MIIKWYGHACFGVESSDGNLIFDPFSDDMVPGLKLENICADVVLCSHGHQDHNAEHKVKMSGKNHGFKIDTINCYHDKTNGSERGENSIKIIESEGIRIVHLGDLGHLLDEKTVSQIGHIDVLITPVGGHYTIDASEATEIAKELNPKFIVPMHYRDDEQGFGFPVIGTLSEFVSFWDNVVYANSCEFDPTKIVDNSVIVLIPDAKIK